MKKTIAILFGGNSCEYEVSLKSASAVITNFPYSQYDLYMIAITREGKWYHYQGEVDKIINDTWHLETMNEVSICFNYQTIMEITENKIKYCHLDAVLPILHGKNGEDGSLQGAMQLANIPVIGSKLLASALCMDKLKAHILVKEQGIEVTDAILVKKGDEIDMNLTFPVYVKPLKAGSSYGISKVLNNQELEQALSLAFRYDDEVIIEAEIAGVEIGCAVIGNEVLEVGMVDEIELSGGFFDFNEKYTLKSSKIHVPARVDKQVMKQIQNTAKLIYRTLGCQTFARIDMFLTPNQEIYFHEVNTIPGFTPHSRFFQMMKGAGYDFTSLIKRIIEIELADN